MDLGFERAGLQCRWQVELNDYARQVLWKHWPDVPQFRDVERFPPVAWIPCECCDEWQCTYHGEHAHECECPPIEEWELDPYADAHPEFRVDCIIGGDPCQSNSGAVADRRSRFKGLGGEFIRIVDALRPRIVVRENPSFTSKSATWPWYRFRSGMESIGYACMPFRLRACCFGTFHQRDRLFLLCERTDTNGNGLQGRKEKAEAWQPSEPAGRMDAKDWMALFAAEGYRSRNDVPGLVERLTGLGNAVPPPMGEWIGRRIIEAMKPA